MHHISDGMIFTFYYADGHVEEHVFPRSCYGHDITLPQIAMKSPIPGILPQDVSYRDVRFRFDTVQPGAQYRGGMKPIYREVVE